MAITSYNEFKQALNKGTSAQQILNQWLAVYEQKLASGQQADIHATKASLLGIINQHSAWDFFEQKPLYAEIIEQAHSADENQRLKGVGSILALLKISTWFYQTEEAALNKCVSTYLKVIVNGPYAAEILLSLLQNHANDSSAVEDVVLIQHIQESVVLQLGNLDAAKQLEPGQLLALQEKIITRIISLREETQDERDNKSILCDTACDPQSALYKFLCLGASKHEEVAIDERLQKAKERLTFSPGIISILQQISELLTAYNSNLINSTPELFAKVVDKVEKLLAQTGLFNTYVLSESTITQLQQEDSALLIQAYINALIQLKTSNIIGLEYRAIDSVKLLQQHGVSISELCQKHPFPAKAMFELLFHKIITGRATQEFETYKDSILIYIYQAVSNKTAMLTPEQKCDALESALNPYRPLGSALNFYLTNKWKSLLYSRRKLSKTVRPINYVQLLDLENHPDDKALDFWYELPREGRWLEKEERDKFLVDICMLQNRVSMEKLVNSSCEFKQLKTRCFISYVKEIINDKKLTSNEVDKIVELILLYFKSIDIIKFSAYDNGGSSISQLLNFIARSTNRDEQIYRFMTLDIEYKFYSYRMMHKKVYKHAYFIGRYGSTSNVALLFGGNKPFLSIEKTGHQEIIDLFFEGLMCGNNNSLGPIFDQLLGISLLRGLSGESDENNSWFAHTKSVLDNDEQHIKKQTYLAKDSELFNSALSTEAAGNLIVSMAYPKNTDFNYEANYLHTIYDYIMSLPESTPLEITEKYIYLSRSNEVNHPLGYLFAITSSITDTKMSALQEKLGQFELASWRSLPETTLDEVSIKVDAISQLENRIDTESQLHKEIAKLSKNILLDLHTLLAFRNLEAFIAASHSSKEQPMQLLLDAISALRDYLKVKHKVEPASKAIQDIWCLMPTKLYQAHIALTPLAESNLAEIDVKLEAYLCLRKLANRIDDIGPLQRIETEMTRLQRKQALFNGENKNTHSIFTSAEITKKDMVDNDILAERASTMEDYHNIL